MTNLHSSIITSPEPALEELDADDGEHEEKEDGDEQDVADVLHRHDHALHHVLQPLSAVDRPKKRILSKKWSKKALVGHLRGRSTRRTLRILTTDMAPELEESIF